MISLQNLKMEKVTELLNTKEEVQEARRNLEDATKDIFEKLQKEKIRVWIKSRFLVLD